jgi:Lon protease-like protein
MLLVGAVQLDATWVSLTALMCYLLARVQVLLQGGDVQRVSAAWVASRLASSASEDKAASKSVAEFCQALMAAGALTAAMDLLLSKEGQQVAAGGLRALQEHQCVMGVGRF